MSLDVGFTIRRRPELVVEQYRRVQLDRLSIAQQILAAFPFINPACYRGLGRDELDPFASLEDDYIQWMKDHALYQQNTNARTHYRRSLQAYVPDYEDALLETIAEVQQIHALLDNPSEYEILSIRCTAYCPNRTTLGFDVGLLNYSIIGDALVYPMWHPAEPYDFAALLPYYRTLNEHVLFDTVLAAEAYHQFYRSRPWGEQGSFQCWQIDAVPL